MVLRKDEKLFGLERMTNLFSFISSVRRSDRHRALSGKAVKSAVCFVARSTFRLRF